MKFIVKLHPEIIMKSESVRKRFTRILESNIRNILRKGSAQVAVYNCWDHIDVTLKKEVADKRSEQILILNLLTKIPGIHHILEVEQTPFEDLHDIFMKMLPVSAAQIEGKTFCVRAKRRGIHTFSSLDLERYVGGGLNQAVATAKVKLNQPEVTVLLEIDHDKLNIVKARHPGLGGFPLGTQEDLLSLISGGYDSGVSSYLQIKRGSKVHYCFFNLGGDAHRRGVEEVAYHLWSEYGSSARVKFITINFEPVVAEILEKIDDALMGVVLKRMFMRAATQISERFKIEGLITGEALGQVSSQTLTNLKVIDQVTEQLILRPLISWDKEDIIHLAKQIGTEVYAKTMPEYCGVISKRPTVKATKEQVIAAEALFDFSLLDQVVDAADIVDIRQLAPSLETEPYITEVEMVLKLDLEMTNQVILDIRTDEERELNPLTINGLSIDTPNITGCEIQEMPFFKLAKNFHKLDQNKQYLLYCDRGIMSRLQALHLKAKGFENIKVYRPN